ncbi:hypothetical protein HERIO_2779 [Hepatospora eriocheir]|uniref:Uncharacterized protein n=1 Tax=Hepatospora eriocheir TaxID=1081669 RepID=A0A1X0Q7N1_9MICR|nr:hypothetical protein HERIO_2779 [Hepatospora eriocheir]
MFLPHSLHLIASLFESLVVAEQCKQIYSLCSSLSVMTCSCY